MLKSAVLKGKNTLEDGEEEEEKRGSRRETGNFSGRNKENKGVLAPQLSELKLNSDEVKILETGGSTFRKLDSNREHYLLSPTIKKSPLEEINRANQENMQSYNLSLANPMSSINNIDTRRDPIEDSDPNKDNLCKTIRLDESHMTQINEEISMQMKKSDTKKSMYSFLIDETFQSSPKEKPTLATAKNPLTEVQFSFKPNSTSAEKPKLNISSILNKSADKKSSEPLKSKRKLNQTLNSSRSNGANTSIKKETKFLLPVDQVSDNSESSRTDSCVNQHKPYVPKNKSPLNSNKKVIPEQKDQKEQRDVSESKIECSKTTDIPPGMQSQDCMQNSIVFVGFQPQPTTQQNGQPGNIIYQPVYYIPINTLGSPHTQMTQMTQMSQMTQMGSPHNGQPQILPGPFPYVYPFPPQFVFPPYGNMPPVMNSIPPHAMAQTMTTFASPTHLNGSLIHPFMMPNNTMPANMQVNETVASLGSYNNSVYADLSSTKGANQIQKETFMDTKGYSSTLDSSEKLHPNTCQPSSRAHSRQPSVSDLPSVTKSHPAKNDIVKSETARNDTAAKDKKKAPLKFNSNQKTHKRKDSLTFVKEKVTVKEETKDSNPKSAIIEALLNRTPIMSPVHGSETQRESTSQVLFVENLIATDRGTENRTPLNFSKEELNPSISSVNQESSQSLNEVMKEQDTNIINAEEPKKREASVSKYKKSEKLEVLISNVIVHNVRSS